MSVFETAHLSSRSVLSVEGPEAREFLQGLITNDMNRVSEEVSIYAALLTPQGKILFEFHVVQTGDTSFLLDVASERADAFLKRLTMYKLRAAVDLCLRPELRVVALFPAVQESSSPAGAVATYLDSRHPDLGSRAIVTESETTDANEQDYHAFRRRIGVPEGAEVGDSSTFLLEANFEELNGVDFKKGCYVGQELAARMKHKTTLRKRLLPFSSPQHVGEPPHSIKAGASEIGQVVDQNDLGGFALIRLDRLNAAQEKGESPTLGEMQVEIVIPEWLKPSVKETSNA